MKDRIDISSPEYILFLRTASRAMRKFHAENAYYPENWYELDIAFKRHGFIKISDQKYIPKKSHLNKW